MYQTRYLDKPCRNFCILSAEPFTDPRDGLAKFAVVSFVNFANGVLYLVDPRGNTAESYELPADNGAWALHNHRDRYLVIGTCAEGAYIHRFDLAARCFDRSVQVEGETYVWDLVDGGDGYLYGDTYSGCKLFRCDPEGMTVEDLGRVSPNPKNLYTQNLRVLPGYVLVDALQAERGTWVYRQSDGRLLPLAQAGELPDASQSRSKTNPKQFALPDGSTVSINGQEYEFTEPGGTPIRRRIPGQPPATGIHSLCGDGDRTIWGTTVFGLTFFRYDTATGAYENTGNAVAQGGGEFYGSRVLDGKLYLTSYSDGYHVVYDPLQPWNAQENENPRILRRIAPDYIRPHGRTVIGPGKKLWTGWLSPYGTYGGALSRIDPADGSVTVFPVGDRGVASVAADDERIYYATFGHGNGMPDAEGPFSLVSVDPDGKELARAQLPDGTVPSCVYTDTQTDRLLLCSNTDCTVRRRDTLEPVGTLPLKGCQCIVRWGSMLICFAGEDIFEADPEKGTCTRIAGTREPVRAAWAQGDAVYFGCGTELWKLTR